MVRKTPSLLWADLTPESVDKLLAAKFRVEQEEILATQFGLKDHKENERNGILMDLYIYAINFAFKNEFSAEKTSTFFSILKLVHFNAMVTPAMTLDDHFSFMKSLLVNHSVQRPPYSSQIFSLGDVNKITDYVSNTYFRHIKMYQYVFTQKRILNVKCGYVPIHEPHVFAPLSEAMLMPPEMSVSPNIPSNELQQQQIQQLDLDSAQYAQYHNVPQQQQTPTQQLTKTFSQMQVESYNSKQQQQQQQEDHYLNREPTTQHFERALPPQHAHSYHLAHATHTESGANLSNRNLAEISQALRNNNASMMNVNMHTNAKENANANGSEQTTQIEAPPTVIEPTPTNTSSISGAPANANPPSPLNADLTKEIVSLASAAVIAQFDRLKSEFDKKLKSHEAVLNEKLDLLETRSKTLLKNKKF